MEEKSRQDEDMSQMIDGGTEEDKKPEEANRSGEKQEQEGLRSEHCCESTLNFPLRLINPKDQRKNQKIVNSAKLS